MMATNVAGNTNEVWMNGQSEMVRIA